MLRYLTIIVLVTIIAYSGFYCFMAHYSLGFFFLAALATVGLAIINDRNNKGMR